MKIYLPLLLLIASNSSWSIELVINGKSYEIDRYQIEENGQKIVIPNILEKSRKPSSYGDLLNDLEGGFHNISEEFQDPKKQYKRNFR